MSEHDPQKHANPPLSPADKDKDAEADHALAMDQRKARYAATLADRAKSLERLYDYTKFHIGVYLSLTTAYIAIATLKPTALPDTTSRCASSIGVYGLIATDPWFMALAVASFMLAGLAGGVIVSSITQYSGPDSADFLARRIGPVTWEWFNGITWTRIEHIAFWVGLCSAIASIAIPLSSCVSNGPTPDDRFDQILKLLEVVCWPVVAILAILVVRPHLAALLDGAKVKLTIAGQSIETTLPEVKQILKEQSGEHLEEVHIRYIESLRNGPMLYPAGIQDSTTRKLLRPIRNAGLIQAIPRDAFLQEARAIELSSLGRLFLSARKAAASR